MGIRPSMVTKTLKSFCQAPDPYPSLVLNNIERKTGKVHSQLNIKKQLKNFGIAKADQLEINMISSGNAQVTKHISPDHAKFLKKHKLKSVMISL